MKTALGKHMSAIIDEKLVYLARNALLVAGMEMGSEGDHWPVIKANIHALMQDYEQLKIELAVEEQLREHLGDIIIKYEKFLTECDAETCAEYTPAVRELRAVYDAMFEPVDPKNLTSPSVESEDTPGYMPWKSSAMIIDQMFKTESADGSR